MKIMNQVLSITIKVLCAVFLVQLMMYTHDYAKLGLNILGGDFSHSITK